MDSFPGKSGRFTDCFGSSSGLTSNGALMSCAIDGEVFSGTGERQPSSSSSLYRLSLEASHPATSALADDLVSCSHIPDGMRVASDLFEVE